MTVYLLKSVWLGRWGWGHLAQAQNESGPLCSYASYNLRVNLYCDNYLFVVYVPYLSSIMRAEDVLLPPLVLHTGIDLGIRQKQGHRCHILSIWHVKCVTHVTTLNCKCEGGDTAHFVARRVLKCYCHETKREVQVKCYRVKVALYSLQLGTGPLVGNVILPFNTMLCKMLIPTKLTNC